MISTAQLQSLEFEYYENTELWIFKEVSIYFFNDSEIEIYLNDFQLFGIRDVRDLRKLIELVYGS